MENAVEFSLIKYLTAGGFFMYPILAVSILVAIISIERFLALRLRFGIDGRRLFNDVKKFITVNDWHRAAETCRQHSLVPLAQVLGAGIANADRSIEEIDTAMESEALFYVPKINQRINYLAMLSNIATLLGLLGTISGLIASFAAVGGITEVGVAKGSALAGGISVAMFCTAFGLIVAIPTLLIHQFLQNRANRLIDDIQHYATEFKKLVQRMRNQTSFKLEGFDMIDGGKEKSKRAAG